MAVFKGQLERDRYHHGDLKHALITASDEILSEKGIEGFTLRAAARRAGVSPGAPAHHFGNVSGLLTEVALIGYQELARYLAKVPAIGSPAAQLRAQATAYVEFALKHPGRFRLMFRKDLVNRGDPRYTEVSTQALLPMAQAAAAVYGVSLSNGSDEHTLGAVFAAWSVMHGIAHLALEDKFGTAFISKSKDEFRKRVLPAILLAQWPG